MSNAVMIIGESGTGKSSSIRTLDPKSTFIINVLNKPLPFRGYKKKYVQSSNGGLKGNYFASYNYKHIVACINSVNANRPDITTIIVDDWQYILSFEFMARAEEKSFDKFSEIGKHGWETLTACTNLRDDLTSFVMCHSDFDMNGKAKLKTIGKLLDEKIVPEGMFTMVLHSRIIDDEYVFQTKADTSFLARMPPDMFNDKFIPNDLRAIKETIEAYGDGDEEDEVDEVDESASENEEINNHNKEEEV